MFVFLLETRSCTSSIKLSSVDTVIIFDSDWNPVNDLRNLQKITLDSSSEKIKVFRLYSSYTLEEKVLILAKHDKILDSKLQSVSTSTSHMLLMWGATYLFSKLSEFHSSSRPVCIENILEQGLLKDVIQEFLMILPQNCNDNVASNSKIIKVTQRQGSYINNYLLHGELESQLIDEESPHIFWKKLLEGKQPQWKYLSGSSQRNRKRVHRFDESSNKLEVEGDEAAKKRKKVANNSTDPPHLVSSLAAKHTPTSPCLAGLCTRTDLHVSQKSLHLLLKPEIAKLCEILQLPEDVKDMVERFLEYVMNNHRVVQEPATILQAFQISLCRTAASFLKHKLDHKKSLALAKQHLHFDCKKEEADFVYSMLRCLKKIFLCHIGNFKLIGYPTSQLLVPDQNENQLHATSLKTMLGYAFIDDEVLSNLGLAQKDFCISIKDIEKKCDKQMKRLLQRQQEEKEDFERKYAEEKERLEHKHKTEAAVIRLHSNSSLRADKLKLLEIEYAKKFEELKFEMEAHRKDLIDMQLMARNKLKDKETRWVEGVRSWATVELVNKPASVETGHNHKRTASVDSWFEDQVPQRAQSMQDGEVPLEIPGTLRSDEDEQVLPSVQTVFGHAPDGVSSTKLQGEVPLRVPKDVGLDDSLINYSPAHTHSLEERIPNVEAALEMPEVSSSSDMDITFHNPLSEEPHVDGAVLQVPHREELSLGTSENVASTDPLSTGVKSCMHDEVLLEIPETPYEAMDGNTIGQTDRNAMTSHNVAGIKLLDGTACVVTRDPLSDKMAALDEQNVGEEILSEQVEFCSAGLRQEEIEVYRNAAKQVYESSDETNIATQQDGKFSSINLDTSPVVIVVGSETGRCQDGEVLADKAADNGDSQSSGKTARVNMQDGLVCIVDKDPLSDKMTVISRQNGESLSDVAVALSEQVEGYNTGLQQGEETLVGKNAASEDYELSHKTNIANQQDGELPSTNTETSPGGVLVGSKTGKGQDGEALTDKAADSEDSQSSSKIARTNLQDGIVCLANHYSHSDKMDVLNQQKSEALSGVAVTLGEQVEGCNAGLQQDEEIQAGKNAANQDHESSDRTNIANQQNGEVPAINRDTTPGGAVAGSKTGNHQDGEMLADRVADNEDLQSCRVNLQDVGNLQEVFQAACSVPTPFTALEDGVPQTQNQNALQQVEVSPGLAHNVVSGQSNGAPVMEHVLPAEIPLDVSVTHVSGSGTMPTTSASGSHPAHTTSLSQIPQPSFQDPLQYELERIRKEADKTTTTHEDMKLQMRLDCEKEIEEAIAQIRMKYETKVQELEAGFFAKKKELDANHNKVLMNKILADVFRTKCMDFRGSTTPGKQQESTSSFMEQLLHLSAQPTAQRPSIVAGVSFPATPGTLQSPISPCPPAAGLRGASPHPPAQPTTQRPSIVAARTSSPGPPGFFQTAATAGPPASRPHGTSPRLLVQPTTQRPSIVAAGMSPSGPSGSLQTTAAGPRGTPPWPQAVHHSVTFLWHPC